MDGGREEEKEGNWEDKRKEEEGDGEEKGGGGQGIAWMEGRETRGRYEESRKRRRNRWKWTFREWKKEVNERNGDRKRRQKFGGMDVKKGREKRR